MADTVQTIKQLVAAKADTAAALAKEIWNYAELSYEETRSAAALIGALKNEGFTIEEGIAGIPTAFTATYAVGSGKPVVGFLAEYDALAGLSQKAACPVQEPVTPGGAGHGCGHNLLARGCYAAGRRAEGLPRAGEEGRHGDLLRLPRRGGRGLQAVHRARRVFRRR